MPHRIARVYGGRTHHQSGFRFKSKTNKTIGFQKVL